MCGPFYITSGVASSTGSEASIIGLGAAMSRAKGFSIKDSNPDVETSGEGISASKKIGFETEAAAAASPFESFSLRSRDH